MSRPALELLAGLALLGMTMVADRAPADLWLDLTGCDQVLVDGTPRTHVRFAVHNAGTAAVYHVVMSADPAALPDTCHTFAVDPLPNWSGLRRPDGGAAWSTPSGSNAQIPARQTLEGFGATLSGTRCCFRITLTNEFRDPVGSTIYCFQCDLPSVTAPGTWGGLKAIYR
jgi:hypothetical protein